MADTKISALTAAGAAALANEHPVNQAGTSKKVTGTQIQTMVFTAPVFAAGTSSASTAPKLTSGTVNTTPEAGAIEYDGKVFYFSPEANNRGVVAAEYAIVLTSDNSMLSQGTTQPIFDSVGAGTLTLPTGTYIFEMLIVMSSMSGTSGNALIDFKGTGTATVGSVLYHAAGGDVAINTAGNISGCTAVQSASPASIVTAAAQTGMHVRINGTFRVTGAGTLIPALTLVTAASAFVTAGSYFRCWCVGSSTVQTVGRWS